MIIELNTLHLYVCMYVPFSIFQSIFFTDLWLNIRTVYGYKLTFVYRYNCGASQNLPFCQCQWYLRKMKSMEGSIDFKDIPFET